MDVGHQLACSVFFHGASYLCDSHFRSQVIITIIKRSTGILPKQIILSNTEKIQPTSICYQTIQFTFPTKSWYCTSLPGSLRDHSFVFVWRFFKYHLQSYSNMFLTKGTCYPPKERNIAFTEQGFATTPTRVLWHKNSCDSFYIWTPCGNRFCNNHLPVTDPVNSRDRWNSRHYNDSTCHTNFNIKMLITYVEMLYWWRMVQTYCASLSCRTVTGCCTCLPRLLLWLAGRLGSGYWEADLERKASRRSM